MVVTKGIPHERLGGSRNERPSSAFTNVQRCGAKTRRGTPCGCPAMKNGRCRLHGGLSTGPKTAEGIARIQAANTKHGRYSKTEQEEQRTYRAFVWNVNELLRKIRKELKETEQAS